MLPFVSVCSDATFMTTVENRVERSAGTKIIKKMPAIRPVLLIAAAVLAITLAASLWIYRQGTRSLRVQAKVQGVYLYPDGANAQTRQNVGGDQVHNEVPVSQLLKQVDDWALRVTMATAAGAAGLMLAMVLGVSWWRRA